MAAASTKTIISTNDAKGIARVFASLLTSEDGKSINEIGRDILQGNTISSKNMAAIDTDNNRYQILAPTTNDKKKTMFDAFLKQITDPKLIPQIKKKIEPFVKYKQGERFHYFKGGIETIGLGVLVELKNTLNEVNNKT